MRMHGFDTVPVEPEVVIAPLREGAASLARRSGQGNVWQEQSAAFQRVVDACDELQAALTALRSNAHVSATPQVDG